MMKATAARVFEETFEENTVFEGALRHLKALQATTANP
jgi:hypothetical protein